MNNLPKPNPNWNTTPNNKLYPKNKQTNKKTKKKNHRLRVHIAYDKYNKLQ